ncbi:hypothetical protein ABIE61_000332 [Marinobacterium sp. MBR-111]|jgi:hypothetical protein|uniref:hypothetical protein n=1 Tax=Marinobacterium sp. MBR-111 TaxID=3156463 RepID=UPI003396336A
MSTIEAVFQLYLMLVGLISIFVAGWVMVTAGFCLRAVFKREPIRPVLKMMMEEW